MGFDVSYHPVDRSLIVDRLIPYIRGEGNIDDLIERVVRIAKVHHRANAWGLKLSKLKADDPVPQPAVAGLFSRLRGQKPERLLPGFHTDLHIWGRPFLITVRDPIEVSKAIDEYLAADEAGVDAIAARMVERLEPGLAEKAKPADDAFLSVRAKDDLHAAARQPLDALRDVYKVAKEGRTITIEDEEVDASEALAGSAALTLVSFYSGLQPGWMARGYVWPTQLLASAGVRFRLFEPPAHLIEPLVDEFPLIAEVLQDTITENYMVGGYVRPENVRALREGFEQGYDRIIAAAKGKGWADQCRITLQKIMEAVADAERRGFGFVEATEVYSGPLGLMN